jgi:hypothetical protein
MLYSIQVALKRLVSQKCPDVCKVFIYVFKFLLVMGSLCFTGSALYRYHGLLVVPIFNAQMTSK